MDNIMLIESSQLTLIITIIQLTHLSSLSLCLSVNNNNNHNDNKMYISLDTANITT